MAAQAMTPFLRGRMVVMLGRHVARAFDQEDLPWHQWTVVRLPLVPMVRFTVAAVPHPSGRNHWYNRTENRCEARKFWMDLRKGLSFLTG